MNSPDNFASFVKTKGVTAYHNILISFLGLFQLRLKGGWTHLLSLMPPLRISHQRAALMSSSAGAGGGSDKC
jgi:hypothetical protein